MNREKAKSLIEAAFRAPKARLHRGAILIPAEPLDMLTVAKSAIETEDEQDDLYDLGLDGLYESVGWPHESLISFYWQSLGPCVWQSGLNSLQLGEDAALISRSGDSWDDEKGVALVKGPSTPEVMSTLFKALISENGAAFGVELFGSLPSNTHNKSEELIPEKIVRAAYWDWMMWAENELDVDWSGMAEEVSARAMSPIMYPLDLLKKFGEIVNGDPHAWLEERDKQKERLSVRAKHAIFDAYFKQSYGPY